MTPIQAIDYMFENMEQYSRYGASDTEPRAIFRDMLSDFWTTGSASIPQTAEDWQLFTGMPGVQIAAAVLRDSAALAIEACNGDHGGFLFAMDYYYGGI